MRKKLDALETYKKMKHKIEDVDNFGCKEYLQNLPLSMSRTLFKHKYCMTKKVQMNYIGDPTYEKLMWKCSKCQKQDTETHLLWCGGYSELRQRLDLKKTR